MAFDIMVPLRETLEAVSRDNDVRVVVLTGAGNGFCSGADLENPGRVPDIDGLTLPTIAMRSMELLETGDPRHCGAMHQPVIAAVNGPAIGGGFCLALACDLRIAADRAYFRAAGINNGLTASELGISYLLPRAIGSARAAEIMLTGRDVTADEAERIGLVSADRAAEGLLDACYDVAERICGFSRAGVELTKRMLTSSLDAASLSSPHGPRRPRAAVGPAHHPQLRGGRQRTPREAATGVQGLRGPAWTRRPGRRHCSSLTRCARSSRGWPSSAHRPTSSSERQTPPTRSPTSSTSCRNGPSSWEVSEAGLQPRDFVRFSPVSGPNNPIAPPLTMHVVDDPDGTHHIEGEVTFGPAYEGPPGHCHGGWIAAIFDELLGFVQLAPGFTAYLKVDYRAPDAAEPRPLALRGWIDHVDGRKRLIRGTCSLDGVLLSEAEGLFIAPREDEATWRCSARADTQRHTRRCQVAFRLASQLTAWLTVMSDDAEIPGQQAFEPPGGGRAVTRGLAVAPAPADRRRHGRGNRTAVGGWGVSDALASGSNHGFPHVAGLSAGDNIDASAAQAAVNDFIVDIDATDGYSGEEDAGTGSVITSDGDVLTNNHVVAGATSITVTLVSTGRSYRARVLGTDASQDVALLKLRGASGLAKLQAGDADAVQQGIAVAAVGNALGKGGTPTVTTGSITGTGRAITASDGDGSSSESLSGLLETDADIVSGDSGGPLVDSSGQVIGMDTAASTSGSEEEASAITTSSDGYAIPITTALSIAHKIATGKASSTIVIGRPGFLGLELGSASSPSTGSGDGSVPGFGDGTPGGGFGDGGGTPGYGYGYGDGTPGGTPLGTSYSTSTSEQTAPSSTLTVAGVIANTPAADAGIAAGDTITSLNGTAVTTPDGLSAVLDRTHGGDRVTVGWTDTSGNAQQATVTLIPGPAA